MGGKFSDGVSRNKNDRTCFKQNTFGNFSYALNFPHNIFCRNVAKYKDVERGYPVQIFKI